MNEYITIKITEEMLKGIKFNKKNDNLYETDIFYKLWDDQYAFLAKVIKDNGEIYYAMVIQEEDWEDSYGIEGKTDEEVISNLIGKKIFFVDTGFEGEE